MMTLDDQDIRALTFLACRIRKQTTGARQWDEDDVAAQIRKLRTRSLVSVQCAVARCAGDVAVKRPEAIPSAGSHWGDTIVPGGFVPEPPAPCRCGQPHRERLSPEDMAAGIAVLRAKLAPTSGPTDRRTLEDLAAANPELHARVEAVRAANPGLRSPPTQEPAADMTEPEPEQAEAEESSA